MAEISTGPRRYGRGLDFAAGDVHLSELRQLSLVKGGHQYVFRYPEGDEESLIQALMDLASRTDLSFDWFDAAVLSRQVNEKLLHRLDE